MPNGFKTMFQSLPLSRNSLQVYHNKVQRRQLRQHQRRLLSPLLRSMISPSIRRQPFAHNVLGMQRPFFVRIAWNDSTHVYAICIQMTMITIISVAWIWSRQRADMTMFRMI